MRTIIAILILFCFTEQAWAQQHKGYQRTSFNAYYGTSGANLQGLDELLENHGQAPLPNSYNTYGLSYQTRFNDFIIGAEIYQNNGIETPFNEYNIDYRTTRAFLNFGYSFTEEGKFHLIHYMSIGMGYLNFEMLNDREGESMEEFLKAPAHGFILRQNDINKGSQFMGGFLTEIGFELGYDLGLLPSEEVITLIAKIGYSFNPFEESWTINGMTFDDLQSGAFVRLGAGLSLPEKNYFYRDASLGIHLITGIHFTKPNDLNQHLENNGYQQLDGIPKNIGIKLLGENRGFLYGIDLFNLNMEGEANQDYGHSLSSLRIYGSLGGKLLDIYNWEVGALGGIGYANVRYSLLHKRKLSFPDLIDLPDYDGELRNGGIMAKPEVYLSKVFPLSKKTKLSLVGTVYGGYEIPLGSYELGGVSMSNFMANPYLQLGVGIRP
ncbi:hypothetical protein DN752_23850 [Echinicola strongylocentroti]|uniref:DUF5723 domain-containing protein n=1 Tax=Echinicola strongylocentroti TaxID=1795355 RepID=A0A2Z4IPS3_9BACT|nr:hypothetical protein [Echinicola strongylocentroti]AWW32915.1 hypothetical protein DN752_23850 [Echinicola strongylocentroti]